MSPKHSENGHGGHGGHEYWYKESHCGVPDPRKEIRIPPPWCPKLEEEVKECMREKGGQHGCIHLIKELNMCNWRASFLHEF